MANELDVVAHSASFTSENRVAMGELFLGWSDVLSAAACVDVRASLVSSQ